MNNQNIPARTPLQVPEATKRNPHLVAYMVSYLPLHTIDGLHELNNTIQGDPDIHQHWNEVCYMAFQYQLVLP